MKSFTLILSLFSAYLSTAIADTIDILQFSTPEEQTRFSTLTKELRCLKCQNSSIAGSNADLAKDLRLKVHEQIVEQKMSNNEIKNWMVARYGDFVLYEPPFKTTTAILWGLPIILGIFGFSLLIRRLTRKSESEQLDETQTTRLNEALK